MGVQPVQGGKGCVATFHRACERLLSRVDADVNLQAVGGQKGLIAVGHLKDEQKEIALLQVGPRFEKMVVFRSPGDKRRLR